MNAAKAQLVTLFEELDRWIDSTNVDRRQGGALTLTRCEVRILGQMSLILNDSVSAVLSLAQTADMDAYLTMEAATKSKLKELLKAHGYVFDEDSHLIWVPPRATFESLFELPNVSVMIIDAESALVSKAIKAPTKNQILVRQAIASDQFPTLVARILENGGKLENFA